MNRVTPPRPAILPRQGSASIEAACVIANFEAAAFPDDMLALGLGYVVANARQDRRETNDRRREDEEATG
jgi:hypothetical protein